MVAGVLGVCGECLVGEPDRYAERVGTVHARCREESGLPVSAPRVPGGLRCDYCARACTLGDGETGYCGVRRRRGGGIIHASGVECAAHMHCYYDPLPTNCVAAWVCGESGGEGGSVGLYGNRAGKVNLAAFYAGCNFDCLFCQNHTFRRLGDGHDTMTPADVARLVTGRTACICYFGGDPGPHAEHSVLTAEIALENAGRSLRVCWETNGAMLRPRMERIASIALGTGGCVKVDCKAFSPALYSALCGISSNEQVLSNIRHLVSLMSRRPKPPLLVVSTLLVPGYVTPEEVGKIAGFLASLNPEIPYSLLGFSPQFKMSDLPTTSREHASRAADAAREAGLKNVHVGNLALLGNAEYD